MIESRLIGFVNINLSVILFFCVTSIVTAQCPTATSFNQSFCDLQSPTVADLQATDNGGGIAWFNSLFSTTPLSPSVGLVNGVYFLDNSSGNCGIRVPVVVTVFGPPIGQNFQGVCVENASDATISDLVAIGFNVQWFNVPTGGTPLSPLTVLVPNAIYYASQTNPFTGCQTSRLSVFVSVGVVPVPTGNSVQVFCNDPSNPPTVANLVASGNNNWYLTNSSNSPLPLDTLLINGQNYYATTTSPPCESTNRLEVNVVLEPLNNPGQNGAIQICEANISTTPSINLFDFLIGTPQTSGSWTGPLPTSGGHLGTIDVSSISLAQSPYIFTYTVASSTTCPPASAIVALTVSPNVDAGTNGAVTLCQNSPSVDLFTLLGGTPNIGGTWSPALASGTGIFNPAVDPAGIYTYTLTGITPCPDATATVTVTVNPLPNAGSNGIATLCQNSTSVDLFTFLGGTPQAGGIWSPPLASGTGIFNPAVDPAGVYTYTVSGIAPCLNQSATVTVTINPQPNPGTNGAVTLCQNSPSVDLFTLLGGTPQVGGTWSPALASGTGIFNPAVDPEGVYTYTLTGIAPCPDATATVTVTVNPLPNAGSNGIATLCQNSTSVDLFTFLGGTPQAGGFWSPALASSTGIFNPAVDPAGVYTYTVSGIAPCPNQSATVTVTINPQPNPGTNGAVTLCNTSEPIDLFTVLGGTPDFGGTWSPTLTSGTSEFIPGFDIPGVYTYTLPGSSTCPDVSSTVTVTVNNEPFAGTNATIVICNTSATIDLYTQLGGNPDTGGAPDTGGVWVPPLSGGNGIFNPAVDPAGVYTYIVAGIAPCPDASATVTVVVNMPPNAGTNAAVSLCQNSASVDLFTLLGGTPDAGGTWSPALASGTGVFNPAIDVPGDYTYIVAGSTPCPDASATVSITIIPLPNAGTFLGSQNVCNSVVYDLFLLLDGTQQSGGVWTDSNGNIISNIIDASTFTIGSYLFTYTVTNLCGSDAEDVQLVIIESPILNASDLTITTPICQNQAATVTINNLPNGTYSLNYSLSGANTSSIQTALITVLNGIPTFIIDGAILTNPGTTTVTVSSITDTLTNCTRNLTNVSIDLEILSIPTLEISNLSVSIICFGQDSIIQISGATNLPNGNYEFLWTIPNAVPSTGTTGFITINNGSGEFTIPGSVFPVPDTYVLLINTINSEVGSCDNFSPNVETIIKVFPLPTIDLATVTVGTTCLNEEIVVSIANASNLSDGSYQLTYTLAGTVSSTATIPVDFTTGTTSFIIPASNFNQEGNYTLSIADILSQTTTICGIFGNSFPIISFTLETVSSPQLIDLGNTFCEDINATIADLSANVVGTVTVNWYDAPVGGNLIDPSTELVDGSVYYGEQISSSGCVSAIRLEVTVVITNCSELIIPDGFSPNGDGINDNFVIKNIRDLYPQFTLEVFNRYGTVLYTGDTSSPDWDGTATKGVVIGDSKLPTGVYFFIINFNDGVRRPYQGRVYLSR